MLPEIGQLALILALLLALCQSLLPLLGAGRAQIELQQLVRPLSYGVLAFVALAFVILTTAFIQQDFSVAYVARNSNSLLPLHYRISAVWGAHEGSLLLWSLILALWSAAVARFSRSMPLEFVARVGAVLGMVAAGFLLFILFTSNPFDRFLPAVAEGADLNPLLQDPGLIIHPPMLYFGYVGFAVPFAFAVAALLGGRVERNWVRWCRPWTLTAWALLTAGIALGSWWAYYELGWGGWWFWDPVENASFMPWLVGTALVHSLAISEKRRMFYNWTLLLSILAFSLSLLGTFLVRSGVLTSVHAFASDPTRGIFILMLLGFFCGGALLLFALRSHTIRPQTGIAGFSRETLLLINNILFAASAGMVLLGTLYPLLVDAFGGGKISVGPPYFGTLFVLLMAPVVLLMPAGPLTQWQRGNWQQLWGRIKLPLLVAVILGVVTGWLHGDTSIRMIIGLCGAAWVLLGTGVLVVTRLRSQSGLQRWELGLALAHAGVGVFLIGVTMVETSELQTDVRMQVGDVQPFGSYQVTFADSQQIEGPNYIATRGIFEVRKTHTDSQPVAVLRPEKRRYLAGGNVMTEAAIDPGLSRDLYIALGEPLDNSEPPQSWSVRLYIKPFIRWIWGGALLILLGALCSASDRRYRLRQNDTEQSGSADSSMKPALNHGAAQS